MKNKSCCSPMPLLPGTNRHGFLLCLCVAACLLACVPRAVAGGDAPAWMHALVNSSLPSYDEKTDAVLLYSETNVTVISADEIGTRVRKAFKILRPEGRNRSMVWVNLNSQKKIKSLHGWCIPEHGKDFEVREKDSVEMSPPAVRGFELAVDVKAKVLQIPAPEPGNIIGFEYETVEKPFFLQDVWAFQAGDPVREGRYFLRLPAGWEYKATWLNYPETNPIQTGSNEWQWTVKNVNWLRREPDMPPFAGVQGQMIVSFIPPGGPSLNGFVNWDVMGKWYSQLISGRVEASPEIKQEVANLTGSKTIVLQKMQAIASFVQRDIRYVAIELGIGGFQPHPAPEVFSHRYGDCKDKATLVRSMLREIGIDSYHVLIYSERGAISAQTPPYNGFNHAILAIKLPDAVSDPSLVAILAHPKLGRILFFDPTDDLTPFGQIRGALQANYGLLVTPDGGELLELPQQPTAMNSVQRTARLTLDHSGMLKGEVKELRLGHHASVERHRLLSGTRDADRIKPIEDLLGISLPSFKITRATLVNLQQTELPFGFNYSFESPNYAKSAGNLLLVRPRVLGIKGSGILETKEPRRFPIEFVEPSRDTDTFEITIPAGYAVDDIPPPVDIDFSFASYHSKTVVNGNTVDYTRTFELKELTVPVDKAEQLRKFYRIIAGDERSTVVLKPAP